MYSNITLHWRTNIRIDYSTEILKNQNTLYYSDIPVSILNNDFVSLLVSPVFHFPTSVACLILLW